MDAINSPSYGWDALSHNQAYKAELTHRGIHKGPVFPRINLVTLHHQSMYDTIREWVFLKQAMHSSYVLLALPWMEDEVYIYFVVSWILVGSVCQWWVITDRATCCWLLLHHFHRASETGKSKNQIIKTPPTQTNIGASPVKADRIISHSRSVFAPLIRSTRWTSCHQVIREQSNSSFASVSFSAHAV